MSSNNIEYSVSISPLRAAYKICELSDWTVTNIEIHKILYLAHMVFLGRNNALLINAEFQAWKYGSVIPKLYNVLKRFGDKPIKKYVFDDHVKTIIHDCTKQMLTEAWGKLGHKANWELIKMIQHEKSAWKRVYVKNEKNTITIDDMEQEYKEWFHSSND